MARPPESAGVSAFVGRSDLLRSVERDRAAGWLLDLQGGPGSGKSTLLARLHREQGERGVPVAWAAVEARPTLPADDGRVVADVEAYSRMVLGLAADLLPSAAVERVRTLCYEGWPRQDALSRELELAVDRRLHEIQDALSAALAADPRRRLVLVDDLHVALDGPLGGWLLALFDALPPATTVVVTRRPGPDLVALQRRGVETHLLAPLQRDEVATLLDQRLGPSGDDRSDVVDRTLAFSGGHPLAVAVATDVLRLRGAGARLGPDDVSASRQGLASLTLLLQDAIAAAGEAGFAQAFEAACVLRLFDAAALASVVDPEVDATAAMRWLETLSFATSVSVRPDLRLCSVHEFIREQQTEQLDPRRLETLRGRGDRFFRDLGWRVYEADPNPDPYLRSYKFEDPHYQWVIGEQTFLTSGRDDRTQLGVDTAYQYFDGFWWWGCFLPFDYCQRVLDQYERWARPGEDQRWLGALRTFHAHYPPQAGEQSNADWVKVERSLLAIRALAGIEMRPGPADPRTLEPRRRHLRGITDVFLAQARREQDVGDPAADELYADAMEMLDVETDRWSLPWVEYDLAELWRRRGDFARALDVSHRGLERARARGTDREVIALLHDVRAQVAFAQGDVAAAFDASGRAMVNAYAFLAAPHPPDEYTRTLYELLGEGVVDRLRTLAASGRSADAVQGFLAVHEAWRAAPGAVGEPQEPIDALIASPSSDLAPYLFPAGPTAAELVGEARQRYGRLARERSDAILGEGGA